MLKSVSVNKAFRIRLDWEELGWLDLDVKKSDTLEVSAFTVSLDKGTETSLDHFLAASHNPSGDTCINPKQHPTELIAFAFPPLSVAIKAIITPRGISNTVDHLSILLPYLVSIDRSIIELESFVDGFE